MAIRTGYHFTFLPPSLPPSLTDEGMESLDWVEIGRVLSEEDDYRFEYVNGESQDTVGLPGKPKIVICFQREIEILYTYVITCIAGSGERLIPPTMLIFIPILLLIALI